MHCPNCGQQQASEQMKFCSRCGFPLGLVSEILANGGFLPQLAELNDKKKFKLNRKRVFKFGLIWFLLFTCLILPITAVLFDRFPIGDEIIGLIAIVGTMGGILLMLFSLFFESSKNKINLPMPQQHFIPQNQINSQPSHAALPPQSANFTPVYTPPRSASGWREAKTGELVPPSITEGTTRLLEKEE